MTDHDFMQAAIDACRRGIASGQSPFGACIVRGGAIIVATHNHVWLTTDITAHAEVHAIRLACTRLASIKLTDCDIFSTTEPCPMCFSAIHWAGMRRIVFGTSIVDAKAFGFSELEVSNEQMKEIGGSPLEIERGVMREQCVELFKQWQARADHRVY